MHLEGAGFWRAVPGGAGRGDRERGSAWLLSGRDLQMWTGTYDGRQEAVEREAGSGRGGEVGNVQRQRLTSN